MTTLLLLAFTLSLDSFRVSLGLGGLSLSWRRQAHIVCSFALCDGVAPLAGLAAGISAASYARFWTQHLGPFIVFAYGVYVTCVAARFRGGERHTQVRKSWMLLGIPLTLSLDNIVAGAALGMIGFPPLASAAILGAASGLAALLGLQAGRTVVRQLHSRAELCSGL